MSRILRPKQIYTEKFNCVRSEYYAVHFSDPDFPEPLFPPPKRPTYAEADIDAYIAILAARRARERQREQVSEAKKSPVRRKRATADVS